MKEFRHENAFLIRFRGSPQARCSGLPGKVEHVASGNTAIFQSVDQLPQILVTMLRSLASEEGNQSESSSQNSSARNPDGLKEISNFKNKEK